MGQKTPITVLPACKEDGEPINGSHRVVTTEVQLVSPTEDGLHSTVTIAGGTQFSVPLSSNEVGRILGWDQED